MTKSPKHILITGADGQLGLSFRKYVNGEDVFHFVNREDCDICDVDAVASILDEKEINIVINCAAYTAVDKAEVEEEKAMQVNCEGVDVLAKACKKRNILLIHYSTDYVYHIDVDRPLKETDETHPIGVYAKSKLCGEQKIEESGCAYFILRTSWVYSEFGNNFMKTMLRLADKMEEIKVVNDQIGNPTYTRDIVSATLKIISNYKEGSTTDRIYNFSNQGGISWYDMASSIMQLADQGTTITPIPSSEYITAAERPQWSVLDCSRIENEQGINILPWKSSLKDALDAFFTVE